MRSAEINTYLQQDADAEIYKNALNCLHGGNCPLESKSGLHYELGIVIRVDLAISAEKVPKVGGHLSIRNTPAIHLQCLMYFTTEKNLV